MPAITVPKTALAYGAGYLYHAAIGTSFPANTVVGSVFTDAWPAGWNAWGVTREGHEFSYELDTEEVEAAEYLDALATVSTGRTTGMSFEVMQIHLTNVKRALNGGTLSTSGAGTTLLSTYTPPAVGQEVRCMIGWESTDNTERVILPQAFQVGSLSVARRKGADNAGLSVEFRGEPDSSGFPFYHYTAGTIRG